MKIQLIDVNVVVIVTIQNKEIEDVIKRILINMGKFLCATCRATAVKPNPNCPECVESFPECFPIIDKDLECEKHGL